MSWEMLLARAQQALGARDFVRAQADAERLLQRRVPEAIRAAGLLVTADAAYEVGAYGQAATRYNRFLSAHGTSPEAPRAALAQGWARFRDGDRRGAARAWTAVAQRFPADRRAPLALVLAARVSDGRIAEALLEAAAARYPSAAYGRVARLEQAILAVRRNDEDAAVRQITRAIRTGALAVIDAQASVTAALAVAGAEPGTEAPEAVASTPDDSLDAIATGFVTAGDPASAPEALHALTLVAAADHGWADGLVLGLAQRLVDGMPSYPSGRDLLDRIAGAASNAGQWPTARRAYEALLATYGPERFSPAARMGLAEALFRTGSAGEARAQLEAAAGVGGAIALRALSLLAELSQALGDRAGALAAYDRLLGEHPDAPRSVGSLAAHARLLAEAGQMHRAAPVLRRLVATAGPDDASHAAYELGRLASAQGDHEAAVEWYLTAVYAAEHSRWARPAMLGAGDAFAALGRREAALITYLKLVADPSLPASADPESRQSGGEAAYRAGRLLHETDRHGEALNMFMTAAYLTAGTPLEHQALVGAIACLVVRGDRASAEALYRRLAASGESEPEVLAAARRALAAPAPSESALPAAVAH